MSISTEIDRTRLLIEGKDLDLPIVDRYGDIHRTCRFHPDVGVWFQSAIVLYVELHDG